jgi:hypothetical protein
VEKLKRFILDHWEVILIIGVVILISISFVSCYRNAGTPDIVAVEKVDVPNVKAALDSAGFKTSNQQAGAIADKIGKQVSTSKPDFKATVSNKEEADKVIKQVAKNDKADVVIKEEKPSATEPDKTDLYYYGIHMEKKHGIGVYTDVNSDGSFGIHIRNDKLIVQVGQKYKDKQIVGRVAYELYQW